MTQPRRDNDDPRHRAAARLGCLAAAGLLATSALATPAAGEASYPLQGNKAAILQWVAAVTSIPRESIVSVSDDLVVAVTERKDGQGVSRSTKLTLREEIITAEAADALGGRSILLSLDLDCTRRRVMLGARRIYAQPDMQGSVRITRSSNEWSDIPPETVVDDVAEAVCRPAAPPSGTAVAQAAPPAAADPALGKDYPYIGRTDTARVQAGAATVAASAPPANLPPQPAADGAPVQLAAADPAEPVAAAPTASDTTGASLVPLSAPAIKAAPVQLAASSAASEPAVPPVAIKAVRVRQVAAARAPSKTAAAPRPPAPPPAKAAPVQLAAADPAPLTVAVAPSAPPVAEPPPAEAAPVQLAAADPLPAASPANPAPVEAPAPTKIAAAAKPVRAWREFAVQIAAQGSEALAQESWITLKAKLPDLIGPRTFAVEPVSVKGRTLYRALLLGFASPDEASSLCKALRDQSVDCILRELH